ncbi:FAD-binding oxidoreductase [Serratia marcescens]|uniref:FAD-dependent oxidoreductase n=1 Tax=Serratia marcescens TaxID=615 RepID=UPI003204A3E0
MSDIDNFTYTLRKAIPALPLYIRGDKDYEKESASWNILTQFKPKYIVKPQSSDEVSKIITIARDNGINKINIRGGGHSFEGNGMGGENADGLVIKTERLCSIEVDVAKKTAIAGTGVLLGQLLNETWKAGNLMIPTGICVSVGLGGQIGCGGYGMFNRKFGIAADHVETIEIVTPDGQVRNASPEENADLFWAALGSGTGSFGVITKCKLKLSDAPKYIAKFTYDYNLKDVDFNDVFSRMQDFSLESPIDITTMIVIWLGQLEITGVISADTKEDFDSLISYTQKVFDDADKKEMLNLNYIDTMLNIGLTQTSAPWFNSVDEIADEGDTHLRFMKIKAGFIPKKLPVEFIDELRKIAFAQKETGARIQILSLNENSGFINNSILGTQKKAPLLMGMSVWIESNKNDLAGVSEATKKGVDRLTWLNEAYEIFYPYTNGGYIGDDDIDEWSHGRDLYKSYYGDNIKKLRDIKNKYDKENIFNCPMGIK